MWFTQDYGNSATIQKYEYLGHTHTLWLYSEKFIEQLLDYHGLKIISFERFHCLSAVVNRITKNEEFASKFSAADSLLNPLSYHTAHNVIMICQKQ